MAETEYFGLTDKGRKRASNQDCFAIRTVGSYLIAVVCDGMGGVGGGNVASELACEYYSEKITDSINSVDDPALITNEILEKFMIHSVAKANAEVYRESLRSPELKGMGTTLVSAVIKGTAVTIGNVGDSRLYHVDSFGITQITKDHSFVQTLLDAGEITESEAYAHPNKNIITRAVGVDNHVECDVYHKDISSGYLLLCSDGLSNYLDKKAFLSIIDSGHPLRTKCEQLIAHANECGGADNITVVLIKL